MNYLLFPTLLISSILFGIGAHLSRNTAQKAFLYLTIVASVMALPGILFAVYYTKVFYDPIWLYQFRSLHGSELSAGAAGLLTGLLHGRCSRHVRFQRIAGRYFFPIAMAIGLIVPYLKPIVRPPHWEQFQDQWSEGVCLQTSESSCGPACAATLLRQLGRTSTEIEIAKASFTSRNGTENWYLARALRERGCRIRFTFLPDGSRPWPFPAIAGVRLSASGNTGHFITILGREGDKYIVGDPLVGKLVQSQSDLKGDYEFTGFFMTVE